MPQRIAWLIIGATFIATNVCAGPDPMVQVSPDKLPQIKPPAKIIHDQTPLRVKVVVYEFDPIIPPEVHAPDDPAAKPKRLTQIGGWADRCLPLAQGYIQDVCDSSGGFLQYEIIEWNIVDAFQKKRDGFTYTPESFVACMRGEQKWHDPDGVDYAHYIKKYRMAERVDRGEVDEYWWIAPGYFGYWESHMVGPDAFWINSSPLTDYPCKRRFAIMGFNTERGVAEMLHSLCHRMESTMRHYYGGWNFKGPELKTLWDKFAAVEAKSGAGNAGVGHCHYPPNAERDYDYSNPRFVESTAEDWLNYPDLTGAKTKVNRETWGGPDYHRNFMKWWYAHLPKLPGEQPDGLQRNWWKHLFDYNSYLKSGAPNPKARAIPDEAVQKQGARRPA